ncbi:MAG TPA: VIT1/CCC1 transporter family protein [Candidatus Saccharimonadales bacterium]|jgi:VIT1/CCC1 family predicted Fe2+/Mn2+ transporter|nr:VIT1/CCC1 transporter family protein [Candidatus Saccharimonadales bacterium]
MTVPHIEHHFTGTELVRDIVIGMSDGLTVPFALAAGISGAVNSSHIVVIAGLAEIAAGSIAMGLGGYLAARSDAEHYESEHRREEREIVECVEDEIAETREIFESYGLSAEETVPLIASLKQRPVSWVDFMMRFELGLERPEPKRALSSAATIAGAYIAGGFIPLSPYMLVHSASHAFWWSVAVTLLALAVFGYIKGRFTGAKPVRSGLQTVTIGGLAAGAAYLIAKAIS